MRYVTQTKDVSHSGTVFQKLSTKYNEYGQPHFNGCITYGYGRFIYFIFLVGKLGFNSSLITLKQISPTICEDLFYTLKCDSVRDHCR